MAAHFQQLHQKGNFEFFENAEVIVGSAVSTRRPKKVISCFSKNVFRKTRNYLFGIIVETVLPTLTSAFVSKNAEVIVGSAVSATWPNV